MPKGSNAEEGKKGFQLGAPKKTKTPTVAHETAPLVAKEDEEIELLSPGEKAYRKAYNNFKTKRKLLRDRWLDREIDSVNRLIDRADSDNNYDDVVDYIKFTSYPDHAPDYEALFESQDNGDYESLQFEARFLASKIDHADGINYEGLPNNLDYDAYESLRVLRATNDLELIDMIVASGNYEYTRELGFNPNLIREHLETILNNPTFAKTMWTLLSNPLITQEFAKTFIENCENPALLTYITKQANYGHLGTENLELAKKRAEEWRKNGPFF